MVMAETELETPFGNDPEEEAEPAPASASRKGSYMCRYCPAGPWPTTSRRSRHERSEHGDKKERETQTSDLNKKTGGLDFGSLSEKAKEFVEALDAAVDSSFKAAARKQLIQALFGDFHELSAAVVSAASHLHGMLVGLAVGYRRRADKIGWPAFAPRGAWYGLLGIENDGHMLTNR